MNQDTLCFLFPTLLFARDADLFLASCRNLAISQQLATRNIRRVELASLFSSGGIGVDREGNFFVQFNDLGTADEWAETLGHEIGHTFHFDISRKPLVDMCEICRNDKNQMVRFESIEDFCNEFLRRWLEINSKEKVAERIKNTLGLSFQTWSTES